MLKFSLVRRGLAGCGGAIVLACTSLGAWAANAPAPASAAASSPAPAPASATAPPAKLLRYSFPVAETGFDPAQVSDTYSRIVTAGIFEAPLTYDYLARPFQLKPLTAQALPEISADFTEFTFRIRPGIYFADDPAFQGQRRELTAQDYVYALKRHYDPVTKSPNLYLLENAKVLGLSELRKQALAEKKPFPYDVEVEGLRALDRYTFRVKLAEPSPRLHHVVFNDGSAFGAIAREVVEFYGDRIMAHPVGTGPFRLAEWRRSSLIALERNPGFRELRYDEQAPANDPEGQAVARRLAGQRLPMVDRVEISIIEEDQPRWLAFLNGESDVMDRLPNTYAGLAIPNNRLAPYLQQRGVQMFRAFLGDVTLATLYNMEHPVVGGYTPEKVALRRAMNLAYNGPQELVLVRRNQAVRAEGPIPPINYGHDPALRSEMSEYSPAKARALLDLYGYRDRDGDGWRETPDGQPLELELATQSDQASRQLAEIWQKSSKAIGIRMRFKIAQWPENLKSSRTGKLMMWGVAWLAGSPDGDTFLALGYGPNKGAANHARFNLPAFNELYIRQNKLPDGPERFALMQQAVKLMVAYAPYKMSSWRIATDLMHPWVIGYRRNPFQREFYKYVDIDHARRPVSP
ncbi:ABC transporter substrate-binding protein [Sphaerotilus microaerophilus]|uniref:Heme-binding protein n=1 Tax=Sphaerotilus microaerophilus TaxID=2914710 RepID=A0ABN6PIH1_9BURK|nr:ABC transporter substrate-binding protein [Sphaerotilus sp. FB-5]BDI03528.1 heme-binding protein [Sphaerotilus sp. FB-5]